MKIGVYQALAVSGSTLLLLSGIARYFQTGSFKETVIALLYFAANMLIFSL